MLADHVRKASQPGPMAGQWLLLGLVTQAVLYGFPHSLPWAAVHVVAWPLFVLFALLRMTLGVAHAALMFCALVWLTFAAGSAFRRIRG